MYETRLKEKLNQLRYQGFTIFERWELLYWFDQKKLNTKAVWGSIPEEYHEEYDEDADLAIIDCDQKPSSTPSRLFGS